MTFQEAVELMGKKVQGKDAAYSGPAQPRANLRRVEKLGLPAHTGIVIRMGDKMERIENLTRALIAGEEIDKDGESIEDNLLDIAGYALLAVELLTERPVLIPLDKH